MMQFIKCCRMYEMVLHEFPARMTDLICTLFGKDPFAVRLCNKMQKGMRSLEYFTTHQVRKLLFSKPRTS